SKQLKGRFSSSNQQQPNDATEPAAQGGSSAQRWHGFVRLRCPGGEGCWRSEHRGAARQLRPADRGARAQGFRSRVPPPEYRAPLALGKSRPESQPLGEEIPVTYVPFRNAHLLAAAVSWAEVLGAARVYIGAVEQDSSGYPDCRPEYYRAFNELIRAGTKEGTMQVLTPLIALRNADCV